jgi:hypothetical protein
MGNLEMSDTPITFTDLSYAIFDVEANAVCTTEWGNLAIFSVRAMAEQWARKSSRKLTVIPVTIKQGALQ